MTLGKRACIAISILTGVALEIAAAEVAGERAAWNAGVYWLVGLPIALVISAAVGFFAREKHWKWTALVAPAQFATMIIRGGMVIELALVWIILTAILSGLFLPVAWTASKLRRPA